MRKGYKNNKLHNHKTISTMEKDKHNINGTTNEG